MVERLTGSVEVESTDQMRALGSAVADLLVPGDLVILHGPLGAGKTLLVQGIGAALGIQPAVTSPTFVIARVHRGGRLPLVHVDAYRLAGFDDVEALDLDATLEESATVVEWGMGVVERLSAEHLLITIDRSAESEIRSVRLVACGPSWEHRLAKASWKRSTA